MARKIAANFVFALVVLQITMSVSGKEPKDVWNVPAMKVHWHHAVNTEAQLNSSLKDASVHMIEADVNFNSQGSSDADKVVIAHDKPEEAKITLKKYLETFIATEKKGIKLDFKSQAAIDISVPMISPACHKLKLVPFYLNADVLDGPGVVSSSDAITLNKTFESLKTLHHNISKQCKPMLSLGWKTRSGKADDADVYTIEHIDAMIKTISSVSDEIITFAVRAQLVAKMNNTSTLKMKELLDQKQSKRSLTIWKAKEDNPVDVNATSTFIKTVGWERVYLDLDPKMQTELFDAVNKKSGASIPSISMLMVLGSLALSTMFSKML